VASAFSIASRAAIIADRQALLFSSNKSNSAMPNDYEAKKAARIDRLHDRAEKAHNESDALHTQASSLASVIPMGQPILVGHHSEQADRRHRERIHNTMGKAVAADKKAKHYEAKARAAEQNTAVSSDDPAAVVKLKEQLASRQAIQDKMRAANKIVRSNPKNESTEEKREKLSALGFTIDMIRPLFIADYGDRFGFASYQLSNNNANISRIKKRIAALIQEDSRPAAEPVSGKGFTIEEHAEENRIWVLFDVKPPRETCQMMRQNGFKWSPTRGAWIRNLNNAGRYAAFNLFTLLGE